MRASVSLCALASIIAMGPAAAQRNGVWEPIGPAQATIFTLAFDPFAKTVVYAGTYFGGLYRTSDQGANWTAVPGPFATYSVLSIEFDRLRRNVFYVGTFQHGLFRTDNSGATWRQINRGLLDYDAHSIAVDPFDSRRIFLATGKRLHQSDDSGETWEETAEDIRARVLLMDGRTRGLLFIGTYSDGVWSSSDSGATFRRLGSGLEGSAVYSLVMDPSDNCLLAGTSRGAFRLQPGSEKWEDISYGQPPGSLTQVIPMPQRGGQYLASSGTGIFVSVEEQGKQPYWFRISQIETRMAFTFPETGFVLFAGLHGEVIGTSDGGKTLVSRNRGLQNAFVGALATVPDSGGSKVLAGTDLGVYGLSPRESLWKSSKGFRETVFELQPAPGRPGMVFAGSELNGVYRTSDGGESWLQVSDGIVPQIVSALVQSTAPPFALFAVTSGGVYRSRDNGKTWAQISPLGNARSVALDPARPSDLLVGADQGQVYLLDGTTGVFAPLGRPGLPPYDVRAVAVAPGDKYYAVLKDGTVHAAQQSGGPWFPVATGLKSPASSIVVEPGRANVVLLGTDGGGIYRSEDFGANWQPANEGLEAAFVLSLAWDPARSDGLYAGTEGGVFWSGDGGGSWLRKGNGLPAGLVMHIVPQGGRGGGVFASVLDHGVHRLDAGSDVWTEAGVGLPAEGEIAIGVNPASPDVVYAAALRKGVFRSEDAGRNWAASSRGMSLFVRGIAVDPERPGTLFAASLSAGVFQSADGGETWRPAGLEDRTLYRLAFNRGAKTLFAATALGISRTTDQGRTWEHLGQQSPFVFTLASHPDRKGVIYLGTRAGEVFRSADSGGTWKRTGPGLPVADIVRISIDPVSGAVYAAASLHGIFKSVDEGETWQKTGVIHGYTSGSAITSLCVDDSGVVYTAGTPVGAFRSTDQGETWQSAIDGLGALEVTSLHCGAARSSALLAGTQKEGVFLSFDQARTWQPAAPLAADRVTALTQHPQDSSLIFAGTSSGLFRSNDAGRSWHRLDGIPAKEVVEIRIDEGGVDVYVAVLGDTLYRSSDNGENWTPLQARYKEAFFTALVMDGPGTVLLGSALEGVIRSQDRGESWTVPASPATVRPITLAIAAHPRDPNIIYAGTAGQGVLKSADGGTSWEPASRGMDYLFVLALAVDPVEPDTVYAGTNQGGVFVSIDAGKNWRPLRSGLFHANVTSLVVDPANHKVIYAGCEGGGVFRMELP